jgi:hypothetical protein
MPNHHPTLYTARPRGSLTTWARGSDLGEGSRDSRGIGSDRRQRPDQGARAPPEGEDEQQADEGHERARDERLRRRPPSQVPEVEPEDGADGELGVEGQAEEEDGEELPLLDRRPDERGEAEDHHGVVVTR